jgi:hypothetical protein
MTKLVSCFLRKIIAIKPKLLTYVDYIIDNQVKLIYLITLNYESIRCTIRLPKKKNKKQ